jgi:hypothetical protein
MDQQSKRKQYNQTFINKHKEDDKTICDKCYGSYSYFNKSHHMTTKKHKNAINFLKDKIIIDKECPKE